jgi:hypothetical protein
MSLNRGFQVPRNSSTGVKHREELVDTIASACIASATATTRATPDATVSPESFLITDRLDTANVNKSIICTA